MDNPFVVTGVAEDLSFCNRRREQAELDSHFAPSK